MERLARLVARKSIAWVIVVVCLVATALSSVFALRVERDDDLLAFLPASNPQVARFREINERFGGLDVGIIGIAVADPFEGKFLTQLEVLTRRLNDDPAVSFALSLSNTEDFVADPDKGGIRADYLMRPVPKSAEESAALRAKVMSRDHVVGQLIAADASAVIIYAFLAPDANPRLTANAIQKTVREVLPDRETYWGGAPFVSTYIYDTTLADMTRLIPWAIAVIVLIIVLSFRDVFGAALALVTTVMGIAVAYGLMGASGVNANIVLSSMPVILFAVGSAYPIHVLVRYYAEREKQDCETALAAAMADIGPPVVGAGLTTVAGLLSFIAMDIKPMREFGLFTALGVFATLVLSLTFVPAVVRLASLRGRHFARSIFATALERVTRFAQRRRAVTLALLGAVGAAGAAMAWRVEARMDNAAFFSEGSPPDRAERFLEELFGGSQFIQLEVSGDMNDPAALRRLQHIADRIAIIPHVNAVTHVGGVLSLVNEAFSGERRIPVTVEQVRLIYRFLQGRPAVEQLVDAERKHALLMVKVDSSAYQDVTAVLARIEALAAAPIVVEDATTVVAARVAAFAHQPEERLDAVASAIVRSKQAVTALANLGRGVADREAIDEVVRFLKSDESLLEDAQKTHAEALAAELVELGPGASEDAVQRAVEHTLPPEAPEYCNDDKLDAEQRASCEDAVKAHLELAADLARSLMTPLAEMWRRAAAGALAEHVIAAIPLDLDANGKNAVRHALLDVDLPAEAFRADVSLLVSGTPVLYRGLSHSVTQNQFKSLGMSLGLVLLIMIALFRSLTTGLLAAVPTVLTLLVIYGFMGARGMHLDIGTSMLASIIIGAGVDFAVHLLSAWRSKDSLADAAATATQQAGPAIWINALMVAAGFVVLTFGDARPLQNVGGLTSAAMITTALATFLALPALARKLDYRRR